MRDRAIWSDPDATLPVLAAADREAADNALAIYAAAPRGTSAARIAALIGAAAAVMPRRAESAQEAELRLDLYERTLADIDSDVLALAFDQAVKTLTFFPTIAEIRTIAASLPAPPRVIYAWRLRQLLRVQPPPPPDQVVDPSEVAALVSRLRDADPDEASRVPTTRRSKTIPSVDDYVAMGLSEEDALTAWSDFRRLMGIAVVDPAPSDDLQQQAA